MIYNHHDMIICYMIIDAYEDKNQLKSVEVTPFTIGISNLQLNNIKLYRTRFMALGSHIYYIYCLYPILGNY